MNLITKHLDKDNLHHAYLIEGEREKIVEEIFEFIKELGINTVGNADVSHISLDSFKIEDARNLKSYTGEKGFTLNKKIFIISANSYLLEAQNSLLKIFEEPIDNTHFFVVTPDTNTLLKTFVSRFYLISARQDLAEGVSEAEKFTTMPLKNRIDFIKELLAEEDEEDEEGNKIVVQNGTRSKALKFLNALETVLQKTFMSRTPLDTSVFKHIFKVREFLRMQGSSTKTLMESVALIVPSIKY